MGVWYAIQLLRTWRRPANALQTAYEFVLFFLLFATLWFQPWYVTWLVALAALHPRPKAPTQAGIFSFTVITSYVVYGFVWFWAVPTCNWGNTLGITLIAVGTTYLVPWAHAVWLWIRAVRPSAPSAE